MRRVMAAAGSAVFFVLGPGLVVGLVPWWLTGWQVRQPRPSWALLRVAGAALIAAGAAVLAHAFVQFVREGLGTPAPVAPPERLVVGGLYRYVRNPMYLAVVATILGQGNMAKLLPTRAAPSDRPYRRDRCTTVMLPGTLCVGASCRDPTSLHARCAALQSVPCRGR